MNFQNFIWIIAASVHHLMCCLLIHSIDEYYSPCATISCSKGRCSVEVFNSESDCKNDKSLIWCQIFAVLKVKIMLYSYHCVCLDPLVYVMKHIVIAVINLWRFGWSNDFDRSKFGEHGYYIKADHIPLHHKRQQMANSEFLVHTTKWKEEQQLNYHCDVDRYITNFRCWEIVQDVKTQFCKQDLYVIE